MTKVPSEKVTSYFWDRFSVSPSHYACKICSNYTAIELVSAAWRLEEKRNQILSPRAQVARTTAKQVIHVEDSTRMVANVEKMKTTRANCVVK